MPTYLDGIGSSVCVDSAGEIVDLAGLDCSSLIGGCINYEHESKVPDQILGKVLEYKKIFSEKDCETDRHTYFWNKIKTPFLYCLGRLFDDKKRSSQEIAALLKDDAENPSERPMIGFSIEGAKLEKKGMVITKSIARKLTLTNLPANKSCVAEMVPSDSKKPKDDVDSLFKGEIEFFNPNANYLEFLQKKEEHMKTLEKDIGSGNGAFIGSQLALSEDMCKAGPGWSAGKQAGGALHFNHPEHGTVSIHKDPSGAFNVKHQGSLAGLKGVSGSFKTPQEAGQHAQNYMAAVSEKKILAPKMHDRSSPQMVGKFTSGMAKAMDAGSAMAAPSALTQGAALAKESRIGKLSAGKNPQPSKNVTSVKIGMGHGSSVTMSSRGSGILMGKSEKSKWLARAEQAYNTWEKKEHFRSFMKKSMPSLALGEIDAIGQVIALRKSMNAEGKLSKMFASYYGKKEQKIPTSQNECNEMVKTTDVLMASEKDKKNER